VHDQEETPTRRGPRRILAAVSGCLFSAVVVSVQIPAVREAIGAAKTLYRFTNAIVPSLGVGAIWIGFALLLVGVGSAWRLHRMLKEGTAKTVAVGAAVIVMAFGGLMAVVSTFSQRGTVIAPEVAVAKVVTKHHKKTPRRHHHTTSRPSSSGSKPAPTPTSTPSATPPPSSSPAPSNSSSGSGGNGNIVTLNKNNHQTAESGDVTGGGTSGEAKNENNEGPVSINIG
jgi:hypothetical protein